jgi:hypothetical protein
MNNNYALCVVVLPLVVAASNNSVPAITTDRKFNIFPFGAARNNNHAKYPHALPAMMQKI